MDPAVDESVDVIESNGIICDNNQESTSRVNDLSVTNKPIEPSNVSDTIKEMIGDLHEKVSKLEEIVKKELKEPAETPKEISKEGTSDACETTEIPTSTKPRIVEIRREIRPLPLPPSFFERSLTDMDEQINHMFVRGVPRTRSTTNHTFTRIISRFNSTETSSQSSTEFVHEQQLTSQTETTNDDKLKRNFKISSLKSSIFGKSFDNDDGTEESEVILRKPHAPWSASVASKRMKFRISSLSRDVPLEAPDLHTGFIMDEAIKMATENERGISKGRSLLQFLEKCIIKNQN